MDATPSHAFRVTPPVPIPATTEAAGSPGPAGCAGRCGTLPALRLAPAPPDSQVGDARFADGGGDGFDGRAERVEELRELPGAFRPPALLHHEAGHGDDIGVEGGAVRHGCGAGRVGQLPPPPLPPLLPSVGRVQGRVRGRARGRVGGVSGAVRARGEGDPPAACPRRQGGGVGMRMRMARRAPPHLPPGRPKTTAAGMPRKHAFYFLLVFC